MRIVAVWLVSAAALGAFVGYTSIGPVFYSWGWYHGLHYTDVAAALTAIGLATWWTRRFLANPPGS